MNAKLRIKIFSISAGMLFFGCATTGNPPQKENLNSDEVESAILAHKDEFRACYQREVKNEIPKPGGKVVASFTIQPDGKVRDAAVQSTTLNRPRIESCILDTLKNIQFPATSRGKMAVIYPFAYGLKE